jgi:hypothetical protein
MPWETYGEGDKDMPDDNDIREMNRQSREKSQKQEEFYNKYPDRRPPTYPKETYSGDDFNKLMLEAEKFEKWDKDIFQPWFKKQEEDRLNGTYPQE